MIDNFTLYTIRKNLTIVPVKQLLLLLIVITGSLAGRAQQVDSIFLTMKAVLKNNTAIWKEVTIYMKKVESTERLKTVDEIMNTPSSRRNRKS